MEPYNPIPDSNSFLTNKSATFVQARTPTLRFGIISKCMERGNIKSFACFA